MEQVFSVGQIGSAIIGEIFYSELLPKYTYKLIILENGEKYDEIDITEQQLKKFNN